MGEGAGILRIASLDASPVLAELIASYLRVRFRDTKVEHGAHTRDFRIDPQALCTFILVEQRPLSDLREVAEAIARVRSSFPQAAVLFAAASSNSGAMTEARRCGARGFVAPLTPLSVLREAVRTVSAGGLWFPHLAPDASPAPHAYIGPCRRKGAAKDWRGPERRRAAKPLRDCEGS